MVQCATLALAALPLAAAFGPLETPAVPDPGPAVGQRLPAFEAADQDGRRRDFASLRAKKGLVLVFFRSADW